MLKFTIYATDSAFAPEDGVETIGTRRSFYPFFLIWWVEGPESCDNIIFHCIRHYKRKISKDYSENHFVMITSQDDKLIRFT